MHELSIAANIVEAAAAELQRLQPRPARLIRAKVAVGEMRQVVREHLEFAYETLTRGTDTEGSALEIRIVPLAGKCEDCGWTGEISKTLFQCAACGSRRAQLVGGMELYLDALEVEYDEPDGNPSIP
jgi:hydrogenase nickel incorporation protein HypA/HybF